MCIGFPGFPVYKYIITYCTKQHNKTEHITNKQTKKTTTTMASFGSSSSTGSTSIEEAIANLKNRQNTLAEIELDYASRGINLVKLASGYRFQSSSSLSPWLST